MKKKDKIKTIILTSMIGILFMIIGLVNRDYNMAQNYYQVYMNGEKIGLITDESELYNLINEEQKDIKDSYNVSNVYPPNGFDIEECATYSENVTAVKNVYDKIKEADDFTIKGYTIKIKSSNEEKEDIVLYVLNKNIFEEAITNVITAFVDQDDFDAYMNNKQEAIDDVGEIIEQMYFEETITIKSSYISVHEKIYTDPIELSQYLLFGSTEKQSTYSVQSGDTIESISEKNKLNTKEFLIANPKFKNENSILAIGDNVNIALINPVLTLVEDLHVVKDEEQVYEKETVYDKTKPTTFEEITRKGVTGIVRTTQKVKLINGEQSQGVEKISDVTIREIQNEITTKGGTKPQTPVYRPSGTYIDTGLDWGWPTNRPYTITSGYEWRWGSFHYGIDISGTGLGSPIYAAKDGVVVSTNATCANVGYYGSRCGDSYGNYIILMHDNGMYTLYGHLLKNLNVSVGQTVGRGQIIGYMGSSGSSTGTHVHFSVSVGEPNKSGSRWLPPWRLYS